MERRVSRRAVRQASRIAAPEGIACSRIGWQGSSEARRPPAAAAVLRATRRRAIGGSGESWTAFAPENHRRARGFRPSSYGNSCKDQRGPVPRMMQRLLDNTTAPCGHLLADGARATLSALQRLCVQQQARGAAFQYWRRHPWPGRRPGCYCMKQSPRELVWLSVMLPRRPVS